MEKSEAIVLDQFGEPWGMVETIENNGSTITVFNDTTIDGTPINCKQRKISRSKKNFEYFQQDKDCEYFTEYKFNGHTFYKY